MKLHFFIKKQHLFFIVSLCFTVLRNIHRIYSTVSQDWSDVLLVTAHPDDETMFFSPLLYHCKPYILVLSNGNFNNKGEAREEEMRQFCIKNNLQYRILGFRDNENWDIMEMKLIILFEICFLKKKTIVTFGPGGVSGHKNHVSCYEAVKRIENNLKKIKKITKNSSIFANKMKGDKITYKTFRKLRKLDVKFKYLKSWSIFQKYFFIFDRCDFSLPIFQMFYGFKNMRVFGTQMVWFRYLYCLVSNYMNSNKFF